MMTRMSGLAVSAAMLLAACGPGGNSTVTGMIDSCATLEAVGVPELIGVNFAAPESLRDYEAGENTGKMSSCGLTSRAAGGSAESLSDVGAQLRNTWFVTLIAWTWPSAEAARGYMDSMRQSDINGAPLADVDGLGDEAVWNGTMHARKGNVTVSLDVRGPAEEEGERSEKSLETELATRTLANLK